MKKSLQAATYMTATAQQKLMGELPEQQLPDHLNDMSSAEAALLRAQTGADRPRSRKVRQADNLVDELAEDDIVSECVMLISTICRFENIS